MSDLAVNRRATFDYEILETIEAGIELKGFEVKSVALGRANLGGSHAIVRGAELWLLNLDIPPYQPKNLPPGQEKHDQKRSRRLLLHKKEIAALIGSTKERGLTIIPLRLYSRNGKLKVALGLARSRKKGDKRDVIRKRETDREIRRASPSSGPL
ncbi:MAG: SsrA-binding protein SmpB [bacterium]|nr:SsrA-binding protein SmpB [bacterium]